MRPICALFLIPFCIFMDSERIVGVGLEEVDLDLEFVGVSPVVVPLTLGNVFGTGVDGGVHYADERAVMLAVLIFGLEDGFDDVGVFLGVFADDGGGAVRRGVVMDDGLKGERRLLHHEAVQALAQIRLMVINQTTN